MNKTVKEARPKPPAPRRQSLFVKGLAIALLLAAIALVALVRVPRPLPPPAPAPAPPATNAPAVAAQAAPDVRQVLGRWLRPDGGYVLELSSVQADGKLEAAYANPRPIRVARAEVTATSGRPRVFIELRDTGYPGCTYQLAYDAQADQLKGVYFQAALQQEFDVVFVRTDPTR